MKRYLLSITYSDTNTLGGIMITDNCLQVVDRELDSHKVHHTTKRGLE